METNVFSRFGVFPQVLESGADELDYYPSGWTKHIHDECYIKWMYNDEGAIFVRLDGTMGDDECSVIPITGVNADSEEFVTRPLHRLTREGAPEAVPTLIYAMNDTVRRFKGEDEFTADRTEA